MFRLHTSHIDQVHCILLITRSLTTSSSDDSTHINPTLDSTSTVRENSTNVESPFPNLKTYDINRGLFHSCEPTLTPREYKESMGNSNYFFSSQSVLSHNKLFEGKAFKTLPTKHEADKGPKINDTFIVLDIETITHPTQNIQWPYLLSLITLENEKPTNQTLSWVKDFEDETLSKTLFNMFNDLAKTLPSNKEYFIYAHNGGKFDYKILLPYLAQMLEDNALTNDVITDDNHNIIQIKFTITGKSKSKKVRFYLRDSLKLVTSSLDKATKAFADSDLSKIPFNHKEFNNINLPVSSIEALTWNDNLKRIIPDWANYETPKAYIEAYVTRDCVLLASVIVGFVKIVNKIVGYRIRLNKFLTISSISIFIYQSKHYNIPIQIIPVNSDWCKQIRSRYVGGRCEVFNSGINIGTVYHFDVPGMYARVMEIDLPYGNPLFLSEVDSKASRLDFISKLHECNIIGIFQGWVEAPKDLHIPVLPLKVNGKLTFPVGSFIGTWTRWELAKALEKGYKVSLDRGYVYKTGPVLKEFSNNFTQIKNTASIDNNQPLRNTAKLILNSLYGKLAGSYHLKETKLVNQAQLEYIIRNYDVENIRELNSDTSLVTYAIDPAAIHKNNPHKHSASKKFIFKSENTPVNITLARAITSKARLILISLFDEVENIGGKLCYTDTDSVFATFPESPVNKPFGEFIWEDDGKSIINKALFIAPKIYYLEYSRGKRVFKVKGVSNVGIEHVTYRSLVEQFEAQSLITFSNQTQFRAKKVKGVFKGIEILDDVSKVLNIFKDRKRGWVKEGGLSFTTPIILDKWGRELDISAEKAKHTHQISQSLLALIESEGKFHLVENQDDAYHVTKPYFFHIKPKYDSNMLYIRVKVSDLIGPLGLELLYQVFIQIVMNCGVRCNHNDVRYIQCLISDGYLPGAITRTAHSGLTMKKVISFNPKELYDRLTRILHRVIEHYKEELITTHIVFKIAFVKVPKIYRVNNNLRYLLLKLGYSVIEYLGSETDLKDKVVLAQKRLEAFTKMKPGLLKVEELLDDLKKNEYDPWFNKMMNALNSVEYGDLKAIRKQLGHGVINGTVNKFRNWASEEPILFVLGNNIISNLTKALVDSKGFTIIDIYKGGYLMSEGLAWIHSEKIIAKWLELGYIEKEGNLVVANGKVKNITIYRVAAKYEGVNKWVVWSNFLKYLSFTSINENRLDRKGSKDEMAVLMKLSNTPITLNKPYSIWLINLLEDLLLGEKYDQINKLFGYTDNIKALAGRIQAKNTLDILKLLLLILKYTGSEVFYIPWRIDFRGRKYPIGPHFRHIRSEWIRPLFTVKGDTMDLESINTLLLNKQVASGTNYYKELVGVVGVENMNRVSSIYIRLNDIYTNDLKNTGKINWPVKCRILELEYMMKHPQEELSIGIVKFDAKCNAYQHLATMVSDKKIMGKVNVLPGDGQDLYMRVANRCLKEVKHYIEEYTRDDCAEKLSEFKLINDTFRGEPKLIRKIVKKTVITLPYGISYLKSRDYVKEALLDNNIRFDSNVVKTISTLIWKHARLETIIEIKLSKEFQKIITLSGGSVTWRMEPHRDFKILIEHYKEVTYRFRGINYPPLPALGVEIREIDVNAAKRAITPNIVHSIDALNASMLIIRYSDHLLPIHDAFMIRPFGVSDRLSLKVWTAFSKIHGGFGMGERIFNQLRTQVGYGRTWSDFCDDINIKSMSLRFANLLEIDALEAKSQPKVDLRGFDDYMNHCHWEGSEE